MQAFGLGIGVMHNPPHAVVDWQVEPVGQVMTPLTTHDKGDGEDRARDERISTTRE